ncbi:MAG: SsrA-binding protein SmpB [Alphaproteobacteria bacterium]|jgi:SsrA-binding protein|nr:SsrA-binding protein SmpB [Alphaproteobacteria bacterium]
MASKIKKSDFISKGQVAFNRRARFDYEIGETFVAGLVLTGTEVKSMRLGHAQINEAYGVIKADELYISQMFIAEYALKGYESHPEKRDRKLLLTKKEIVKIINALNKKGAVLVAIKLFFDEHGRAKLEVGLGKGKKLYDKRETIKERDWQRDKARLMQA